MMLRDRWILSKFSNDLFFIFLPGILGLAVLARIPEQTIYFTLYAFFASTLVDSGHVYTTVWRTVFRREERASHPIYWAAPLAVVTGAFVWIHFKIPYLWSFVLYATIHHHVGQFYGFLRWYEKLNKRTCLVSGYFLFTLTIIPLVLFHFRQFPKGGLYTEQDIFFYPNLTFFSAGLWVYGFVAAAWLLFEVFLIFKRRFEPNRFLAIFVPAFLYAYCFLASTNIAQVILPLLLAHGIPYMAVMSLSLERLEPKKYPTAYKALAIIVSTAVIGGVANTLYENHMITISNIYVQAGIPSLEALLIGIYLVPVLCHYIYDGHIWKSKHKDAKLVYSSGPV